MKKRKEKMGKFKVYVFSQDSQGLVERQNEIARGASKFGTIAEAEKWIRDAKEVMPELILGHIVEDGVTAVAKVINL